MQQIRGMVEQELQRLGRGAPLRVEGHWLVVGKGDDAARADLQGTLAQWDSLPDDLQQRRVLQIAQLLAQVKQAAPLPRRQRLSNRPGWFSAVAPALVVLVTGAALLVAYRFLSPQRGSAWAGLVQLFKSGPSGPVAPANSADPDQDRALRANGACDRARARVSRGGNITPADVEGWQVELVLLRRGQIGDLTAVPALAQFVRRPSGSSAGTLIWQNAASLVAAQRFDAQVEVRALPSLGESQLSGLSLVFSGPYVVPYFNQDLRADYHVLADALAEALSASDGALFAHCANSEAHAIGSWFLGADPGAAVGSLVYFMAAFSDTPMLKSEVLHGASDPQRRERAFDAIGKAASGLERGAVATLIGRELGMISGRPKQPSRLTFPFRDANRATRSSLDAARALGLASEH